VLRRLRAGREELVVLGATVLGLAPGFMVPFVASVVFSAADADVLLLGYAIMLFLTTVVGLAVEANTIGEYGRHPTLLRWARSQFTAYSGRLLLASAGVVVVVAPLLTWVYSSNRGPSELAVIAWPFALGGFVAAVSGLFSGVVAARGGTRWCVGSMSLRALPALTVMLTVPQPGIVLIAWCFVLGEVLRAGALAALALRRPGDAPPDAAEPWQARGALWQMLSTSSSQVSPAVDRWFLTLGGPGSIAAYEIADKAFYAGYQLVTGGLLLRRVAAWGDLEARGRTAARRVVVADARRLAGIGLLVAPFAVGAIAVALVLGLVPDSWSTGLMWAAILCVGLPLGIVHLLLSRLLVVLRQPWRLLPLTFVGLASNLVLDIVFFLAFGPIGIVLSTVGTRFVVVTAYVFMCAAAMRRIPEHPTDIHPAVTTPLGSSGPTTGPVTHEER
jgi:Na+-driven multidrug efflux pump